VSNPAAGLVWLRFPPDFRSNLWSVFNVLHDARNAGSRCPLWSPNPLLESQDGPVYLRPSQQDPIINLEKTLPAFNDAMKFVRSLAAKRGTILMIGTKRQAREFIAAEAKRCGMPYVDQRWLGGMMTNFKTVKGSLKKLKDMQAQIEAGTEIRIKKEALMFQRDDFAGLALGAEHQDRAAAGCQLAHELQGLFEERLRLLEVDDVDLVAMAVDVRGHLGVPEARLVTEMDTGFQNSRMETDMESPKVGSRIPPLHRDVPQEM